MLGQWVIYSIHVTCRQPKVTFFDWWGGLKKAAACGFFGVLLWLLLLLVGLYVVDAAAFAVLPVVFLGV